MSQAMLREYPESHHVKVNYKRQRLVNIIRANTFGSSDHRSVSTSHSAATKGSIYET